MKNKKCHICDYADNNPSENSSCCSQCGTDFTESTMEKKIMSSTYAYGTYSTKDKWLSTNAMPAFNCLTDRRLLSIPQKMEGHNLTTVLTSAIINKMTSKDGVISIPFDQIKSVRVGKYGLFRKAIVIDTTNGELLKITVSKQKKWREAIINLAPNLQ